MNGRVQYLCNQCKTSQLIHFNEEMKKEYISSNLNGLSLFSHIHLCENGLAGVNNLYIDHNMNVRSYSFIEIPQYKRKIKMKIPGAPKIQKQMETIKLTHISYKNDINLFIQFEMSEFSIQIGPNNLSNSVPEKSMVSSGGFIRLHYFESGSKFTSQLEQWLMVFIDNLEILIPGKLGIIVEILQFIIKDRENYPSDLDKNIIKTILVSHDIFFDFIQGINVSHLAHAYGEENGILMLKIMDMIEKESMIKLHEMVLKFKKSIVTIMFALLILEMHGVIIINRPGIMSENFDMNALLSI